MIRLTANPRMQRSRPQHPQYASPPPDSIQQTTLGELLKGRRTIAPEQQERLGFDSRGLDMKLWCVGDISLVQRPSVSIVGTRQVSPEGAARARRLGRELAQCGVVTVSGLAKGVDTHALASAMQSGGRVIAVIGTPVTQGYPAENRPLQEAIYRGHLLVSQFPPGQRVFQSNFPERNKLMAAIAEATVIIEAGETSGTLHQAAECVRLGRWLFVARSVVDDPTLKWPKKFSSSPRFRVLTKTEDLLDVLGQPPCQSLS